MTRLCLICNLPLTGAPQQRVHPGACERQRKAERTAKSQRQSWKRHSAWGRTSGNPLRP